MPLDYIDPLGAMKVKESSPSERLRNICAALEKDLNESPFTREEWERMDAERLELLAVNDALSLEVERMTAHSKMFAAQLVELQSAAWDVCDVVQDALDTPEDADMKRIQAALDVMGELIPAQRPTDRETAKHGRD